MLGPGLLKLESSQAQARDGRDYRGDDRRDACDQTSEAALTACQFAAKEDYNLALGKCENVSERKQDKCEADAKKEFYSALEECDEQFEARQDVCEEIGPEPYLPRGIKSFRFIDAPDGNNYFPLPLTPTTYRYKSYDDDEITETIVVKVTNATREILGVTCRVVQDTVYDGDAEALKIEDTFDWYAEDADGNTWYFGEISQNFNEEGILENIDGSWTAGLEGAKPGIIMYDDPLAHEGETYRQEFALSEAEDVATIVRILSKGEFATEVGYTDADDVPEVFGDGPFLHTQDFTPLEPGVLEDKYYAHGVGMVLEVNPETGERVELVEMTTP